MASANLAVWTDLRDANMQQMTQAQNRAPARPATTDPRWAALRIVQSAMETLSLRDRDIAVLRGLLSFIPADHWDGPLVVYASNAALQSRCDGIDERTLRRRLARLSDLGLIRRNQSPNRKRYVVRDETGAALLTYGFDMAPLRAALGRLQAIGEEHAIARKKVAGLKAVLRDRLYKVSQLDARPETVAAPVDGHYRLLRRKASVAELDVAIQCVEALLGSQKQRPDSDAESAMLTDSDGQTDRHIQSSNKEYLERRGATPPVAPNASQSPHSISISTCMEAARSSIEFAQATPRNWSDLAALANQLAPAIGVDPQQMHRTRGALGERGASLAILGLVEAYPRIREPARYLNSLVNRATTIGLNVERMFRSLTGWTRFPAGNQC